MNDNHHQEAVLSMRRPVNLRGKRKISCARMAHGNVFFLYSTAHSSCFAAFDFLCLEQVSNLQWTGTVIEKKNHQEKNKKSNIFSLTFKEPMFFLFVSVGQ